MQPVKDLSDFSYMLKVAGYRGGDVRYLVQTSAQPARSFRSGRGPQPQAGVSDQAGSLIV
jgi:hypothetical protein